MRKTILLALTLFLTSCGQSTPVNIYSKNVVEVYSNNKKEVYYEQKVNKSYGFYWKDRKIGSYTKIPLKEGIIDQKNLEELDELQIGIDDIGNSAISKREGVTNFVVPITSNQHKLQLAIQRGKDNRDKHFQFTISGKKEFDIFSSFFSDIDKNGISEIAYKFVYLGLYQFVELTDPPTLITSEEGNTFNVVMPGEGVDECLIVVSFGIVAGYWGAENSKPHIANLRDGKLIDISYQYPKTLRGLWEDVGMENNLDKNPYQRLVFAEQIGEFEQELPIFLKEEKNHAKIFMVSELIDCDYVLQADNPTYHKKWYNRENPFYSFHSGALRKNKCKNLKESWEKIQQIVNQKGFASHIDIKGSLFFEEEDSINNNIDSSFDDVTPQPKRNWEIEPGSYWPERRLGKHEMCKIDFIQAKDTPNITEEHFDSDVVAFSNKTYKKSSWFDDVSDINPENLDYLIIPASDKDFFILADWYPSLTAVSLGDASNGFKSRQIMDWQPEVTSISLVTIGDVNCDGNLDFVFHFEFFCVTENNDNIRTFSIINGDIFELQFDFDGLGQIEFFCGINNGKGQYGTNELGWAPVPKDFDVIPLCGTRFSPFQIMELRSDGYVYDVTYNYPDPRQFEAVQSLKNGESIAYYKDLVDFDVLGLTREAQNSYLSTDKSIEPDKPVHYQIIKDCMRLNKPFLVQTEKEVPKNWKAFKPQR